MKALTISPPWPFAIFYLGKDVENRFWVPSHAELKPGEWFLVHGGRTPFTPKRVLQDTEYGLSYKWAVDQIAKDFSAGIIPTTTIDFDLLQSLKKEMADGSREFILGSFDLPGIIGAVEYKGFARGYQSYWAARDQYQWLLGERILFPTPIPCRGAQKLWNVPDEIHLQAREQYKQARQKLALR